MLLSPQLLAIFGTRYIGRNNKEDLLLQTFHEGAEETPEQAKVSQAEVRMLHEQARKQKSAERAAAASGYVMQGGFQNPLAQNPPQGSPMANIPMASNFV